MPVVFQRQKRGGFSNRVEGYGMSRKVWTCLKCRAWHDQNKPRACVQCASLDFLYFDSAGEARHFIGLMRAQDAGELSDLVHHPRYPIHIFGVDGVVKVFDYIADSEYIDRVVGLVTADFKPKSAMGLDPTFKLKRKCFEAQYGRAITLVTE